MTCNCERHTFHDEHLIRDVPPPGQVTHVAPDQEPRPPPRIFMELNLISPELWIMVQFFEFPDSFLLNLFTMPCVPINWRAERDRL